MPRGLRDISGYDHERFMTAALEEAGIAGRRGDLPIACVIVHGDRIIARGSNNRASMGSRVHHAENGAVLSCAPYLNDHGPECILYTTLEPCIMCLGTILMGNIRNIVFALEDKYMNTLENAKGMQWIRDRVFNYVCGIKRAESIELIRTYCSPLDVRTILEGIRK
jgi:tRNA(adenine34) deaminase